MMTTDHPNRDPDQRLTAEERKRLVELHRETMQFRIDEQEFYLARLPQLGERLKKLQNGGES